MGQPESTLARAVQRACGETVTAVRPIRTLGGSGVFGVDVGDRHAIVKDQPQPTLVDIEVWGLEHLAALGLRVPAVIAVDTTGDTHPRAFFVADYIEGVPITAMGDGAHDALVELGRQLRAIHEAPAYGYGLIGGAGTPGVGMYETLSEATRAFIEYGLRGLERNGWIDSASARRVRSLFDAHKTGLDACPPRLLHGDVKAEHVLVDPVTGRLAGLIDPHPWSGEPAYDLARLVATGGEHMRGPLLSAYDAPSADLDARWEVHELSFLLAITFGHRRHSRDPGAEPDTWNHRLLTALRALSESA